ncbi:hypothetical protein [Streptomyces lushanensis]|uniref:hypothetical protein n=1 Tax=Streptomyces lushanensis TaxID=1434255 RepID=UPI001475E631|nr:hypothetical protein [Streptomyces lushanensis]
MARRGSDGRPDPDLISAFAGPTSKGCSQRIVITTYGFGALRPTAFGTVTLKGER